MYYWVPDFVEFDYEVWYSAALHEVLHSKGYYQVVCFVELYYVEVRAVQDYLDGYC